MTIDARTELENLIDAFERSHEQGNSPDVSAFLPETGHPSYRVALGELIRIDLEYAWARGEQRRIEHYQARFPLFIEDVKILQGIAYEEYRLRRQAGEFPSPLEYFERFGLPLNDWPW